MRRGLAGSTKIFTAIVAWAYFFSVPDMGHPPQGRCRWPAVGRLAYASAGVNSPGTGPHSSRGTEIRPGHRRRAGSHARTARVAAEGGRGNICLAADAL